MKSLFAVSVCMLSIMALPVHACSCAPQPADPVVAVKRGYDHSGVIFLGKVVSIEELDPDKGDGRGSFIVLTTFEVERVWKGEAAERLVTRIDMQCCVCGIGFWMGARYLVYGGMTRDGFVHTSMCTRTGGPDPLDIAILDALVAGETVEAVRAKLRIVP